MKLSGGQAFEAKLREISQNIGSGVTTLRVGFLEGATYPDGKPVAMIAAIQDFGAPRAGIPPRPFFRNMIRNKRGEWPKAIADLLQANDYNASRTLDTAGEQIEGQLRESIINTNSPPLKPATIVAKGGTRGMRYNPKDASTFPAKPLIDSGHMLDSVAHEVVTS